MTLKTLGKRLADEHRGTEPNTILEPNHESAVLAVIVSEKVTILVGEYGDITARTWQTNIQRQDREAVHKEAESGILSDLQLLGAILASTSSTR